MKTPKNKLEQGLLEYLACEEMLNTFFAKVTFCTKTCLSKPVGKYRVQGEMSGDRNQFPGNVGCCPQDYFRFGNYPEIEDRSLLEERREEKYGLPKENKTSCGYHTLNGCVLNTHKAPLCIAYLCQDLVQHLDTKYGITYSPQEVEKNLELILAGKKSPKKLKQLIKSFAVAASN